MKETLKCVLCRFGDNYETLSEKLGITKRSVINKMNGDTEWTLKELRIIRKVYNLTDEQVMEIFFAEKVSQTETGGETE